MAIDLGDLPYNPDRIYDLGLPEITQSSLGTFLDCDMKFVLSYLMRLRSSGISVPLVVGTAVHLCLDMMLDPTSRRSDRQLRDECVRTIDKLFNSISDSMDFANVANPEKLEHGRAQAHAIVEAWPIVHTDHDGQFKVVATEQVVRAKPGVKAGDDLSDRMAGKIDGIVINLDDFQPYILEHKTRYSLKNLNIIQGLTLNQQVLFYASMFQVWLKRQPKKAVQVTVKGKKVDLTRPAGFYYDAIAKPNHKSGETFEILKNRMLQAMLENQAQYFSLMPVELPAEVIDHAFVNFQKIVERMDQLDGNNVTQNYGACDKYGGCPFRTICMAGPNAADPASILEMPEAQLYRISDLHNELDDMSLEEDF